MADRNDDPLQIRTAEDLPEFCVPDEVAQFFRVDKGAVMIWLRNKDGQNYLPHARKVQGNRWKIPKTDVLALAERLFG
ncbi:hypothetical protein Mbo2_051 [Rhodococcus phage Mbo2]|uniref:Helix-turn-helix domain-containing protein n=1 Tax=Rhodococcus phage Mbo2 TaxID=2936911 RepID=A0A9E7IMC4_9CAUD|nr:hypothetical protein Mbo2_051 [Rhodococcus phage Mbo2]